MAASYKNLLVHFIQMFQKIQGENVSVKKRFLLLSLYLFGIWKAIEFNQCHGSAAAIVLCSMVFIQENVKLCAHFYILLYHALMCAYVCVYVCAYVCVCEGFLCSAHGVNYDL